MNPSHLCYQLSWLCGPIYVGLMVSLIPACRMNSFVSRLASHGKLHDSSTGSREQRFKMESWTVSKYYFSHFYRWAFLWILCVGYVCIDRMHCWMTWWLVLLHVIRRLYECEKVHIFRGSMHVFAYLLGLLHYTLLPLVLVAPNNNLEEKAMHPIQLVVVASVCVTAQWQQFCHHKELANLRSAGTEKDKKYFVPCTKGFQYSYCPHYFAEIVIYVCIMVLLHPHKQSNEWSRRYNHILLCLWVFFNLSVSAHKSKQWYMSRVRTNVWKAALIPFLF